MPIRITMVRAFETLDSRGRPTLSVTVGLAAGTVAHAGVPAGVSTGSGEAVELRDHDLGRYGGQGVRAAVDHVNGTIADALRGHEFPDQGALDGTLIDLDGTPDKSRLGANALVGVSMAAARAAAAETTGPLWQYLNPAGVPPALPVPHFNVLGGGAHAANPLDFQEFMIAPLGAPDMAEAVRAGAEVYAALGRRLARDGHGAGLGDEGGFAPDITRPEDALAELTEAISEAGHTPGRDGVAVALAPAATGFRQPDGTYRVDGESLTSEDLIARYQAMIDGFPVWSIEDGLAEDDHDGWALLTRELGGRVQLVGDDTFATDPAAIARGVGDGIANASLIKPNQIGTVTETLAAMRVCREAGYGAMVSHRSGETGDTFIADLAVGSGCGQIKAGAPARGERVAKYNRLLEIAARHPELPYGPLR
jgi:enolase